MRDKVKRFISILMTALMLVNLMPVGALADGITSGGYQQQVAASTGYYTVYVYAKINGTLPEGSTADVNADQWYTLGKISNVYMSNPKNYDMDTLFGYEVGGVSAWSILSNMTPYPKNDNYKKFRGKRQKEVWAAPMILALRSALAQRITLLLGWEKPGT